MFDSSYHAPRSKNQTRKLNFTGAYETAFFKNTLQNSLVKINRNLSYLIYIDFEQSGSAEPLGELGSRIEHQEICGTKKGKYIFQT